MPCAAARRRVVPAPRRHRQRQDRGVPRRGRGDARRRPRRPDPRAGDRPHAPAGRAGARPLRRRRRRAAQRARPARALGRVAAHPRRARPASSSARARRCSRRSRRLGLLVVDEEHDAAYKQEDGIRYNARDLAVVRARLGVAPSWSSRRRRRPPRATMRRARAATGCSRSPTRPTRAAAAGGRAGRPARARPRAQRRRRCCRPRSARALETNLAAGGQTLVFLNRRGFATYLQCPACGVTGELSRTAA